MNTKLYRGILLRVMVMFAIPFVGSFIHDIPDFDVNVLGDVWKENVSTFMTQRNVDGYEWGVRHYLLNWGMFAMCIVQIIGMCMFIDSNTK